MTITPTITSNFNWPMFIIDSDPSGSGFKDKMAEWLEKWCDENCSGQYFLSTRETSFTCRIPVKIMSPLHKQYPSSEIRIHGKLMLAFEKEEDAVHFKTIFGR